VEAATLSMAGWALGVLVGVGLARAVAYFAGWTAVVSVGSIGLALAVSITIGLVFGVYSAMKAARLDPVVALHYE
jgi:putative ABC transport system permease protein